MHTIPCLTSLYGAPHYVTPSHLQEVVKTLEEKRKARAEEFYQNKKRLIRLKKKAEEECKPRLEETNKKLAEMGYA